MLGLLKMQMFNALRRSIFRGILFCGLALLLGAILLLSAPILHAELHEAAAHDEVPCQFHSLETSETFVSSLATISLCRPLAPPRPADDSAPLPARRYLLQHGRAPPSPSSPAP